MTVHTVESGDSVYSIARQYGVPPARIITDNLLENPGKLVVGEDLLILFPTKTHTVRGGENLNYITTLYGVALNEIYRNNPILNGSPNIYPGQVLNISYEEPHLGEIGLMGYAYPNIDRTVLRRTLPYLTYISVFSYGIRDDGALIMPEGNPDEVVRISREYGTVPLLVLTSLSERGTFSSELAERVLISPELSDAVIRAVAETVRTQGYGGVDVDFEYIPSASAAAYADFVKRLNDELGEDYTVFTALSPKVRTDQPGLLYEGHLYRELGEASDYTLLMTYEWGYSYGPPLPVAPINEVRRVLDYAVTQISRDKIFMGVPNYGYDWALPYVRGESRAESLSNKEAVKRASERQAAISYDEAAQSPYYTYYDRPATYDDAVEHIVWFQNARSSIASLELISQYGLKGAGVWNIMRYFPAFWTAANLLYSIRKLN